MKSSTRGRVIGHSILLTFAALTLSTGVPLTIRSIDSFRKASTSESELYEKQTTAMKSLSKGLAANTYSLFICSDSAKTVSEREECSKKTEEKHTAVGLAYDKEMSVINREKELISDVRYTNTLTAIGGALISLVGVLFLSLSVFIESILFLERRRARKVAQTEGETS